MAHRFPKHYGQSRAGARYGPKHQRERKTRAERHRPSDPCSRCGHELGPMGPHLHLDHDENGGYLGFSHGSRRCPICGRKCNIRAGAQKGQQITSGVMTQQPREGGPEPRRLAL